MFVAALAIFGSATMFLWNAIMTSLFHLPVINFWQALGLLILSRLLAGGIGSHAHALSHFLHHNNSDCQNRIKRWEKMTPEERTIFHEKFHQFFDENCDNITKQTISKQTQES
jgi:hypothetical protein